MSRRLRRPQTLAMLGDLLRELEAFDGTASLALVRCLDGKPLPVSRHSQDKRATFGRGAGGKDRGYKLHAIYGNSNLPQALAVTPLNVDERNAAALLIPQLSDGGYVLADSFYDANHLYDNAASHGQVLVTPRRYKKARGLGRHRHSPHRLAAPDPFTRELLVTRKGIETRFAHLCNFGGGLTHLPPWVRGQRVGPYVQAKIAIRLARDQRLRELRA